MPSSPCYGPFGSIIDRETSSMILVPELYPPPSSSSSVIVNPPSPAPNQAMIFLAKQAVSSFIKAITLAEGSNFFNYLVFLAHKLNQECIIVPNRYNSSLKHHLIIVLD